MGIFVIHKSVIKLFLSDERVRGGSDTALQSGFDSRWGYSNFWLT